MKGRFLIGAAVIALLVAAVIGLNAVYESAFGPDRDYFRRATTGMDESEIVAMFGEPREVVWGQDGGTDYYLPGYSYERRDVSKKVLIYVRGEAIAYIYIGDDDRVEHVFVGGS